MLKELLTLIKWLFSSSPVDHKGLEVVEMTCFPFEEYNAMSWCGRLITRDKKDINSTTIRHETTHLKQAQQYSTWIGYYFDYFKEWWSNGRNYYDNVFEREAYANEDNSSYNDIYNPKNINKYHHAKSFNQFKNFHEWKQYLKSLKQ